MFSPWVRYPIAVAFAAFVMYQVRKPSSGLGRVITSVMNASHSRMTDWGLQHVPIEKQFTILDVGCGGGRTIRKHAAAAPDGMVYGIDYVSGSVAASRAENRDAIEKGRVEIQQASVSPLPFPDAKFDLVSAVETIYYWPDPVKDLQEILRVLKPGGRVIVICETYKGGRWSFVKSPAMKLLGAKNFSVDEMQRTPHIGRIYRGASSRRAYKGLDLRYRQKTSGFLWLTTRMVVGGQNKNLEVAQNESWVVLICGTETSACDSTPRDRTIAMIRPRRSACTDQRCRLEFRE